MIYSLYVITNEAGCSSEPYVQMYLIIRHIFTTGYKRMQHARGLQKQKQKKQRCKLSAKYLQRITVILKLFRMQSMHATIFQNCIPELDIRFSETLATFPSSGQTVQTTARNGSSYFHLSLVRHDYKPLRSGILSRIGNN